MDVEANALMTPAPTPPPDEADNPLLVLLNWLRSQSEEVRTNVATLVGHQTDEPIFQTLDFLFGEGGPKGKFEEWISDQSADGARRVVSRALILRELIQFFVIDHFGSRSRWETIAEDNTQIAADLERDGHGPDMTAPLENIARTAEFRSRLWERSAASWKQMVDEKLSNERLRLWLLMNDQPPEMPSFFE